MTAHFHTARDELHRCLAGATQPTLLLPKLPSHFPGHSWLSSNHYPDAKPNAADFCDHFRSNESGLSSGQFVGPQWDAAKAEGVAHVIHVSSMYLGRGAAHPGPLDGKLNASENKRRDCLHWCVAPGVLDLLAQAAVDSLAGILRQTLATSSGRTPLRTASSRNRHGP